MTTTNALMHDEPTFRTLCVFLKNLLVRNPTEMGSDLYELAKVELAKAHLSWAPDSLTAAMNATAHVLQREIWPPINAPPRPPVNEMALQVDPPWGPYQRGSSQWTSLRDLLIQLPGKPPLDPST